jgi:hypothetical protein
VDSTGVGAEMGRRRRCGKRTDRRVNFLRLLNFFIKGDLINIIIISTLRHVIIIHLFRSLSLYFTG